MSGLQPWPLQLHWLKGHGKAGGVAPRFAGCGVWGLHCFFAILESLSFLNQRQSILLFIVTYWLVEIRLLSGTGPRNSIAGCYSALPWCCKQRSTRSWCLALHVAIGGGQAIQRTPVNLVEFGRYDIREFTGVLSSPKWCRVFSKRDYELLAAIRLSWKFLTWAWRISNQQIDSFAAVVTHQERSLHNEVQDVRSEKSFSSMVGVMYRVDVGLSFK